jgi:hypothetical protein
MDLTPRRYVQFIEATLARQETAAVQAEPAGTVRIERGLAFVAAVTGRGGWDVTPLPAPGPVVDRNGHRRAEYSGLLVYSLARAGVAGLGAWVEQLTTPAGRGDGPAATWAALACFAADRDSQIAREAFARIVARQRPDGAFARASPVDGMEAWGYDELVTLHAVASYAAASGDPAAREAAFANAAFQQAELQPDHATNQPWGLHAFVWNPATRGVADQLLHAAGTVGGDRAGGSSALTSILLADALYCLRLIEK